MSDYRANMVGDGLGNFESNGITDEIHAIRERLAETVALSDPRLARIIRLRLLGGEPYFLPDFDVSYCYGELKDGTAVRVSLPFYKVPKRGLKGFLIEQCKAVGVYGKGLGIFDDSVLSILN